MSTATERTTETSHLACYPCKRRKVKCNRALPQCSLCTHTGAACDYPTSAGKPGPKLGTVHTNKRRRNTLSPPKDTSPASAPSVQVSASDSQPAESPQFVRNTRRRTIPPQRLATPPDYAAAGREVTWRDVDSPHGDSGPAPGAAEAPAFSQIMYPSHEAQTRPHSPCYSGPRTGSAAPCEANVESICSGLGISVSVYTILMELYFEYMTAFSLFKPNTIEDKFKTMASTTEAQALVAAMFAFSARFVPSSEKQFCSSECPTPGYFSDMAAKFINEAFADCGDATPPFWLLQASVLDAFYHLTRSVRSKSWRLLGNCIRLAYDMKMHLIDVNWQRRPEKQQNSNQQPVDWSSLEEQRRCWWAIWEMDVFASTIRRLPTAIDWKQNFTFLPMPDENWFTDVHLQSCFLAQDPIERWKGLSRAGNCSPRAWFIVINSLMHDAQLLVYNPGTSKPSLTESQRDELAIISNSLYCATASLPSQLKYNDQILDFRAKRAAAEANFRQFHSDIYAIHLMTQLTQFMVFHHKLCAQAPWTASTRQDTDEGSANALLDPASWSNYMKTAEAIVSIVRNSDHEHFKCVNPFLNNTLWFAAAAQIACVVFGPSSYSRGLLRSNYEMLALIIDRFIEFWTSMDILRPRLRKIESALRNLAPKGGVQQTENGKSQPPGTDPVLQQDTDGAQNGNSVDPAPVLNGPFNYDNTLTPGDAGMLAFMPLFDSFDDVTLLAQQTAIDDFEQMFPFGLDGV